MKNVVIQEFSALAIATASFSLAMPMAQAQIEVGVSTPTVSNAGTLNEGNDHFVEVEINGDNPLQRLKIVCVTFHELSAVRIVDASGAAIPSNINYGFEEFTITFDDALTAGKQVRIIMEDSRVGGRRDGLTVPYQVFATYPEIGGEIPIGTALITIPSATNR
ncbi:MAG: hypothetical protein F6K30_04015 [Cyanothece sp. SIO2G6]|nr:hypothetical protein [Cyanothece sp. SIO2G6]